MKKEKLLKRGLASLLAVVLAVGLLPMMPGNMATVKAADGDKTVSLGTDVIKNPTAPTASTDTWKGSYVYFGTYGGNPVKYRVLDKNTTVFGGTTMLLDCDSILWAGSNPSSAFDDNSNDWANSNIRTYLNETFLTNNFSAVEQSAIASSTKSTAYSGTDGADGDGWDGLSYASLSNDKIFFLDAKEATNTSYGYSNNDGSAANREKTGGNAYWWLRSADTNEPNGAGLVYSGGDIIDLLVNFDIVGVSPAFNVNLQSVLFSSVISGTAGETGAEYKLTLLDDYMTIALGSGVTKSGNTVTIPYSIEGTNSGNATQVSVLILDKEYTVGNTNGATVLAYDKLNVDSFSTTGTGTFTLPDSLSGKKAGTDYHIYIVAEDVNGEKETDYASTPVEITPTWKAPTVKQMNFGTKGIIDPAVPNSSSDAWKGSYVYYGNYDADGDGTAEPVKYRVLDASTTDFSADGTTKTMLLDCDSILYYQKFDNDGTANEDGKKANDWSISDIKSSLNGKGFLNKEGVFTTAEKNAIVASTVDTHTLTTDNVADWTQNNFVNYVALTGEQIFLLDAEDVSNGAYGYSKTDESCGNRKKTGSSAAYWWLRSAHDSHDAFFAGFVSNDGNIYNNYVHDDNPGVSPALNLNLSSVLFSSANAVSKSSALTSGSTEIGTVANTEWKLTLKDDKKSVEFTEGRSVTKASDETITVPYTYTDKEEATDREKVNQISVMITDKAYGSESAQILYYGALQDIKNAEGNDSTVAKASTGTGTFALPSGLTGTLGTDYHIYLLAEHVNDDNNTDYASEPLEVEVKTPIETVTVPSIDTPIAEQPLKEEITVSSEGVANTAGLTWKKNDTEVTGNAQWKTTYRAYVTLTATDGYSFMDATGNRPSVTLNGQPVDTENITLNADGTLTVYCGEYTTATRKTESAAAPEVPTQFANYYTADNVLSSTELGTTAKVTLEGKTQPNPKEMEVEWAIVDEEGNATTYDATPTATNTFKWTVKASQYADYNKDNAVLEGTVAIKNKDYIPVTITVNKAAPNVTALPTVADRIYHPSTALADTDITDGTVKDVSGNSLAGTWRWKEADVVPTVDNDGYVAVFTPEDTVHYQSVEKTISVNVSKATPYIKTAPTATAITYGEALSASTLKDAAVCYSESDEKAVKGTFTWKEAATKPTVADSGKTEYVVIFKPTDKDNYNEVETKLTLTVNKAEVAPNKPESTMNTVYTNDTVGKVTLPEGWVWQDTDKNTALTVGSPVTATAVYDGADKGNYLIESVEISITRLACTHATTETRDAVAATCTVKGYTGDTYCKDCGAKLASGKEIEMIAHKWDAGKVTKEATETAEGVKTYTCSVCGKTKTEAIPKKTATTPQPPKKGAVVADDKGTGDYKVTDVAKKEVTYQTPANKKLATISVPATVKIGGVTYKVTSITDSAFANNKKITKVTIGSNVTTIGKKAFYKCTKLKKITIPSKVKKIGKQAFYGCKKLKTITIKTTKLNSKNVGSKAFKGIYAKATIKVPKSKLKSYKKLLKARGVGKKAKIKK